MVLLFIPSKLSNSLQEPLWKALTYHSVKFLSQTPIPTPIPDTPQKKDPIVEDANVAKSKQILGKIITKFNAPISYAFAYGSGVFKQKGYENEKKKV